MTDDLKAAIASGQVSARDVVEHHERGEYVVNSEQAKEINQWWNCFVKTEAAENLISSAWQDMLWDDLPKHIQDAAQTMKRHDFQAENDAKDAEIARLRAAITRQVNNITRWRQTGNAASPEESREIYHQLCEAIGATPHD